MHRVDGRHERRSDRGRDDLRQRSGEIPDAHRRGHRARGSTAYAIAQSAVKNAPHAQPDAIAAANATGSFGASAKLRRPRRSRPRRC